VFVLVQDLSHHLSVCLAFVCLSHFAIESERLNVSFLYQIATASVRFSWH